MQSNSSKHHDFLIKRKLLQIQNKSISTKNIFGTIDARSKFHSKLLLKVDSPNAIKDKKLKKNQNSFNIQNNFTNNNIKTTLCSPRNRNNSNEISTEEIGYNNNTSFFPNLHENTVSIDSHKNKNNLLSLNTFKTGSKKKTLIKNSFGPISSNNNSNSNIIKNNLIILNHVTNSNVVSPYLNPKFSYLTDSFKVNAKKYNNNNNQNNSSLSNSKVFIPNNINFNNTKSISPPLNSLDKTLLQTDVTKGINYQGISNSSLLQKKLNKIEEIKIFSDRKDNFSKVFQKKSPKHENEEHINDDYSNSKSKGNSPHSEIQILIPLKKINNKNVVQNEQPSFTKQHIILSSNENETKLFSKCKYDCDLNNSLNKNDSLLQYINAKLSRNKDNNLHTSQSSSNSYSSLCSTSHPENFIHFQDKDIISSYIKSYYKKHKMYPSTKINFYKYGRLLGRGAFAKVLLCLHVLTGRLVAIKTISKRKINTELKRQKMEYETSILKTLSKSNYIVKIYEEYETQRHICIVMEYICAGDLLTYIKKRNKLTEQIAKYIFKQILLSLHYIHSHNIIHRDIKLDNILIDLDNNIRICDFGVSKQIDPDNDIMHEQCGTPVYMAPELLKGEGYKGFSADLWSTGVVLYTMLSGTIPFKGNNVKDVYLAITNKEYIELTHISKEAQSLLKGLLEINPSLRLSVTDALKHPWLHHVDVKNKNKYNLFTNAERVLLEKSNVDYRNVNNKKEMLERFNIKNINTIEDQNGSVDDNEDENCSLILAPYNSHFSTWKDEKDEENIKKEVEKKYKNDNIDLYNKELKVRNHCMKFKSKVKEQDRTYELNNNGEIDNGIVLEEIHKSNNIIELSKETEYENSNINESSYDYSEEIDEFTHNKEEIINKKILKEVVSLGYNSFYVQNSLDKNFFNYATTSYYLIQKFSA